MLTMQHFEMDIIDLDNTIRASAQHLARMKTPAKIEHWQDHLACLLELHELRFGRPYTGSY